MQFPVFIFHELLIRLSELNPAIGRYASSSLDGEMYLLITTNGSLLVPVHMLELQFRDPRLIGPSDLYILAKNFRAADWPSNKGR